MAEGWQARCVNITNKEGDAPLYLAICREYVDVVKELLKVDTINVSLQTKTGLTALHIAAQGHTEILKELLSLKGVKVGQ